MTELEQEKSNAIESVTNLIISCKDKDRDDIQMIVSIFVEYMIKKSGKIFA